MGAINEILPKATGVGKRDPNSDLGEIFNSYEGEYANVASGDYSHAEGYSTSASSVYSHAEGQGTKASGACAHAEGRYTITSNAAEHAEGQWNLSYSGDDSSAKTIHSVGIGSSNADRKNAHEIKFNGDHYIYGLGRYNGTNSADAQTLQEVINSKQETITAGTGLEFEGNTLNVTLDTTVFKVVSVLPDAPAQGDENKIHLVPAESTGASNAYTEYVWVNSAWEILGEYTSEVDLTPYLKIADAALTYATIVNLTAHTSNTENPHGVTATQVGLGNVDNTSDADKPISTAVQSALDKKQDSTDDNLATTDKTVVGAINEILPKATGVGKIDSNSDGTGEIFNSYRGAAANEASGLASHAEGANTTASASGAHAEGYNTTASGNYSHAEGYNTTASGNDSHSEGNRSTASGSYSHAEGDHTEAFGASEHSEGKYNKSYKSTSASVRVIHSVGIGSAESDRKNAHEIKINGDHYVYGLGNFDGTNSADAQTLQEVINTKADSTLLPTYTTAPTLIADYNIPANATTVEKVYDITVGDTLFNITYDPSIKWENGVAPITTANHRYLISIINNLGAWGEF